LIWSAKERETTKRRKANGGDGCDASENESARARICEARRGANEAKNGEESDGRIEQGIDGRNEEANDERIEEESGGRIEEASGEEEIDGDRPRDHGNRLANRPFLVQWIVTSISDPCPCVRLFPRLLVWRGGEENGGNERRAASQNENETNDEQPSLPKL